MQIELKILNKEFYGDHLLDTSQFKAGDSFSIRGLPYYATQGSAAIDLICTQDVTIYPGEVVAIPTGIALHIGSHNAHLRSVGRENWIQSDYAGLILPRSGLGSKGLILANTIGLIDEDYQGEIVVKAWNRKASLTTYSEKAYLSKFRELFNKREDNKIEVKAGDRFAQLLFIPVIKASFNVVEEFTQSTERGEGGWGHTGE